MRWHIFALVVAYLCTSVAAREDQTTMIGPAEAAKKVDELVTIEMEVKSANLREQVCFLNSEKDFKDAKNFTVFIGRDALEKFKQSKIEDPATHFKGKVVRVKGKVTIHRDKPQIALDLPDQIVIVDKTNKN